MIQRAMAMRPKGRYQSVAEFAHDLQMVMSHLPTPPPMPAKPATPNPHTTQPDLDDVYDQMVADGRIPAAPDQAGPASTPQQQTQSRSCTHCGSLLPTGAATCPNCGASVIPAQPSSARVNAVNAAQARQQAGGQGSFTPNNTMLKQAVSNPSLPPVAQTPSPASTETPRPAPAQQQPQQSMAPQPHPQAPQRLAAPPVQGPPPAATGSNEPQLNLRILLPVLLGALILLALITVFVVSNTHH